MAGNSRSPEICPWDPGEVCKVANGASLPPRKRLLAGLKQNGWLSSSASYLQGGSGASCTTEELKMEVDPGQTKHECSGDALSLESPVNKQSECAAVVNLVSVKSKRATKRRKSLSVLADCHRSVKNLQPELLKSPFGGTIEENVESNKASMESLLASKKEKESVPSYKEMAHAARAAATMAAKAAVEAKAIALEKAAAAAKAAAIARAALEAVALAAEEEVLESKPSRHVRTSCQQNRIGEELKRELGSGPRVQSSPHLLLIEGINDFPEKKTGHNKTPIGRAGFDETEEDEETEAVKSSTVSFHDGAISDEIKEGNHMDFGSSLSMSLAIAGVGTSSHKYQEAEQAQFDKICSAAVSPLLDDEKLARQLHRAMNSSPRIARSQVCLENFKKRETPPSSIEACTQVRYGQVGGCRLVKAKKQNHKEKLRFSRTNGRADVKVKSMSAINETLNMLQNATVTRNRNDEMADRATRSYVTVADNYAVPFCPKDDDSMANASAHEEGGMANSDVENSEIVLRPDCISGRISGHFSSCALDKPRVGRDDESRPLKSSQTKEKLMLRRTKKTTESIPVSSQNWDGSTVNELLTLRTEKRSDAQSNVATELAGSDLETSDDEDNQGRYDDRDKLIGSSGPGPWLGPGPRSIAGGVVKGSFTTKNIQENSFYSKSSRATRKISDLSLCGERQKRGQKILGVLANGLSEGSQNFRRSIRSYVPSPTVS